MNLRQMEAFRAVMLTGSVTQASERLFKTQPAVSMLINSLEKEIGFQLFERVKKRLHPTPEANYLYTEIETIFSRINDVNQTLLDIQNKQYGFLRIGCMPGPSTFFMPDLVADFLEEHPKIHISLQTRTSDTVAEWVASNQYDIGLAEITQREHAIGEKEPFPISCICALPKGHPLTKHEIITPALLDNEPMISLYPDHKVYHRLQQLFEQGDHHMNIQIQTRFFLPALRLVERKLGVCVIDTISAMSYRCYANDKKIEFRRFEPSVYMNTAIMYPADTPRSILTESFAKQLRKRLKDVEQNIEQLFT